MRRINRREQIAWEWASGGGRKVEPSMDVDCKGSRRRDQDDGQNKDRMNPPSASSADAQGENAISLRPTIFLF
jgi:hypothetical protein